MPLLSQAPDTRELVARRYQVLNMLGRGGFGEAYRAVDRLSGRVVLRRELERVEALCRALGEPVPAAVSSLLAQGEK